MLLWELVVTRSLWLDFFDGWQCLFHFVVAGFDVGVRDHFGGEPFAEVGECLHFLWIHILIWIELDKHTQLIEYNYVSHRELLAAKEVVLNKLHVESLQALHEVLLPLGILLLCYLDFELVWLALNLEHLLTWDHHLGHVPPNDTLNLLLEFGLDEFFGYLLRGLGQVNKNDVIASKYFVLALFDHRDVTRWIDILESWLHVLSLNKVNGIKVLSLPCIQAGHFERSWLVVEYVTVNCEFFGDFDDPWILIIASATHFF